MRVANALGEDNVAVDKLVQLDPVRCGSFLDINTYGADNVAGCVGVSLGNILIDDSYALGAEDLFSSIESAGIQVVPDNVVEAVNYYQTGGGITGEKNVQGALNVNANQLIDDPSLFHGSIDEDRTLRNIILNDIESRVDNNVLMTGQGGSDDFGTLALTRNDDGSTDAIDIPFAVNIDGNEYDEIYINNNGNVTFDGPYGTYTPSGFEDLPVDMIAPFWSDVDTRCADCGEVYLNVPTSDVAIVTWKDVGFYNADSSKTNTFQLVLRDRNDLEGENTDVEFRYGDLQWTTGDASGGTNGLGGTHAFAGFTGGEGDASQTLLGSGTSDILTLNQRSNAGRPGRWAYALRNGRTPGTDPNNPLLPDVREDGWHF